MSKILSNRVAIAAVAIAAIAGSLFVAVPASSAERQQRPNITIQNDKQWDAEHGVRSGAGTARNPYVISGWTLNALRIENTNRHVVIRDNTVKNQMVLDWIGDRAHVYGNQVGDLRVNQNVRRTGLPTSGEIAHNTFGVVGQLRHWDGAFERNVVGTSSRLRARAVNFDGYNGAHFAGNKIYGYMDARLHGHHHSSGFGASSHQHSGTPMSNTVDHSQRYHQVFITGNAIRTEHGYALAYLDTNHAANDRTAASEQDPALNKPHVHYTRVYMSGNRLSGAGILVNVFNASDRRHIRTATGIVEIRNNRISLGRDDFFSFKDLYGIDVLQAQDLSLRITGNRIVGYDGSGDPLAFLDGNDRNAGIFLHTLDKAQVSILSNYVSNRAFGVRAEQFTKYVRWTIRDLRTANVDDPVYQDQTVKDSPN